MIKILLKSFGLAALLMLLGLPMAPGLVPVTYGQQFAEVFTLGGCGILLAGTLVLGTVLSMLWTVSEPPASLKRDRNR